MEKEKQKDKNIKLSKCPNCGHAFYVKTSRKGDIKIICPFCEQEVVVKINEEEEKQYGNGNS